MYNTCTLLPQLLETIYLEQNTMIMKRKLNISIYVAFAAALVLFVTDLAAGNYGNKKSDIVDTAVSAGTFNTLAAAQFLIRFFATLKSDYGRHDR